MLLVMKLLLVLAIPWFLDGLPSSEDVGPLFPPILASRTDGQGHGAYCLSDDGPAVFLGRDLPGTPYTHFESWCLSRGGTTGWNA